MTNKQILSKAIEKAYKSGFVRFFDNETKKPFKEIPFAVNYCLETGYYELIFSHDFAKAFWGEKKIISEFNNMEKQWAWQYHLMRMVLEEEPLQYLKKFL